MEYQTIKENGKVKFVVLPVEIFEALLDRLEDESDLRALRDAEHEPLYDQKKAEEYIFMKHLFLTHFIHFISILFLCKIGN